MCNFQLIVRIELSHHFLALSKLPVQGKTIPGEHSHMIEQYWLHKNLSAKNLIQYRPTMLTYVSPILTTPTMNLEGWIYIKPIKFWSITFKIIKCWKNFKMEKRKCRSSTWQNFIELHGPHCLWQDKEFSRHGPIFSSAGESSGNGNRRPVTTGNVHFHTG